VTKTITVTVVFMTTTITIASMAVTATFVVVRATWTFAFAVTHAVGKSQAEMSFEMSLVTAARILVISIVAVVAIVGQIVSQIVRSVVVRQDIGDDRQVTRHVVINRRSITRAELAGSVDR